MPRMPYSSQWQRMLSKSYGDQKAHALISRAQTYYDGYCAGSASERNHANRTSLKTRVLPGLSIYKTLREENEDHERVLTEVETLFRAAFFTNMTWGIRLLNILPNPFFIVRPVLRRMTGDPASPGAQGIVEDSEDCFAVNVYRCYILDTLASHHAAELTPLFCLTDDWLAEALPKIRWERTKTLGRGDDCCDFRWCRIK
jgi:hypothetical protein